MSQKTLSAKGLSWVELEAPSNEELAGFVREANLLPADAEFIVRDHQRPEIAVRDEYMLVLIHVPVFDKELRVTSGVPLYILITEQTVRTLHYGSIVSLEKLFKDFEEHPDKQEDYFEDTAMSLALYIIAQLNAGSFRKIQRLSKHIEIAEDAVFQGNERKMVEEIAILTRDVLDFRKIVRPQRSLFQSIPGVVLDEDVKAQWQRVYGQVNQLWELLESLLESAKEMRDTNDSLLQHKENELLRLLTYYSIVAIPAWVFVTPYDPRASDATPADQFIFWGVLSLLILFLGFVFLKAKRNKAI